MKNPLNSDTVKLCLMKIKYIVKAINATKPIRDTIKLFLRERFSFNLGSKSPEFS